MLRNTDGGGEGQFFRKKALQRCKVQCYLRYEGVGGGPISRKKTLRNTWMASKEFQDTRPIHVIVGGVIVGGVYAEPRMTSRPNSDVQ